MRLLNTKTILTEAFPNSETPRIPEYAILSHKWEKEEISLQEMQNPSPELRRKAGYKKVRRFCEQAASVGFEYAWVDTCCIDKTNNVELTEAINSMFQWYRGAQVCYSYLADVPSSDQPQSINSEFRKSAWFTRGWTLQELLAPLYVVFFGDDWTEIGSKASLREVISNITGIPSEVLLMNTEAEISVAQRMAWAANRETSRVEDRAYCLLGLFGISMPMIYGEGERAFTRLQLEIMKSSDDQSLFAWTSCKTGQFQNQRRGLLARSPEEFLNCHKFHRSVDSSQTSAFSMTNKGLHIELPLLSLGRPPDKIWYLAILNCQNKVGCPLGIYLQKDEENSHNYVRVATDRIEEVGFDISSAEKSELYVTETDPSKFDIVQWIQPQRKYIFSINKRPEDFPHVVHNNKAQWEISEKEIRLIFTGSGNSGLLMFEDKSGQTFAVVLGVHNYNVWCDIANDCGHSSIKELAKEYCEGKRRHSRWNNLDRRTVPLSDGSSVSLAIKQGRILDQRVFVTNISAGGDFRLDRVGPGDSFLDGW